MLKNVIIFLYVEKKLYICNATAGLGVSCPYSKLF